MQKKQKQRRIIIFALALIIAFLVIWMVNGNQKMISVVVVNGDIDISQPLNTQTNKFSQVEVTKNAATQLPGILTDINELSYGPEKKAMNRWLAVKLEPGTPVPKSMLVDSKPAGKFAQSLAKNKTYFKFTAGVTILPPGVAEGDYIDIALYVTEGKVKKEITPFMQRVRVALIVEQTNDLYIEVSQKDSYRLSIAQDTGKFILQLPGQKDVVECSTLSDEQIENSDCYNESDAPTKTTLEDIEKELANNKTNQGAGTNKPVIDNNVFKVTQ